MLNYSIQGVERIMLWRYLSVIIHRHHGLVPLASFLDLEHVIDLLS